MERKKIGIITYHFARNYGAILQCFALQKALEILGHNAMVLNYITESQEMNNSLFHKRKGIKNIIVNLCLLPFIFKRINKENKFNQFVNLNLKCTERAKSIEELHSIVEKNNFSCIISGSDQVWNPRIEDFNKAFFFPFATSAEKISYAASVGSAISTDLSEYYKYLEDFCAISVREKQTIKILKENVEVPGEVVSDPVMLLKSNQWNKLIHEFPKRKEKYLLCYFLHKDYFSESYKLAKKIAKSKGLKLKVINARFSIKSFMPGTILDVGPLEFVALIRDAEFICTDSFHGTLYSILFSKQFYCFDSVNNKTDMRRQNLLDEVGLSDRIVILGKNRLSNSIIDYLPVMKKVEVLRNKSIEFLVRKVGDKRC